MSESSTAAATSANLGRTLRGATPLLFLGPNKIVTDYYGPRLRPAAAGLGHSAPAGAHGKFSGVAPLPRSARFARSPQIRAEWLRALRRPPTNSSPFIAMLATIARSKGLHKFIPQPDRYRERYGNFTLTARDMEILETVYRYRFLEARHVYALIGGSDQQITRRLQGLFHNGYLGRYARRERMRLELDPGAPMIAYGLELKGARALERNRTAVSTVAEPVRWKKEYTRRTEWFLEHHLMVSNFRCVLERALRDTPDTELVTWSQGRDIWFWVSIPGARKRVARLAPDAYFAIRQRGQLRHFYVEVDRGTEEHRRIVDKFVGYWWYLQDSKFRNSNAQARANVVFVTTSSGRMQNLIGTLRRMPKPNRASHGGKGMFRFCDARSIEEDRLAVLDLHSSPEHPTYTRMK